MTRQSPLLDGYLTTDQLAKQIGVSPRTLSRWHVHRIGPPRVVIGRTILYKLESVIGWLASREQRPKR